MARLEVLLHGGHAGSLTRNRSGRVVFDYTDEYLSDPTSTPLSVSVPLLSGHHDIGYWLEGLLPDNSDVRNEWRRKFGVTGNSPFDILSTPIGHDCAGAVQFCSADEVEDLAKREGGIDWLSKDRRAALVEGLRSSRTTWHESESSNVGRFSLSGAQAKTAVVVSGGRYGIPTGSAPSTHIIKPTINDPGLPDQALNEHLCLETAANLGMPAALTEVDTIGEIQCLLIERFDRAGDANGNVFRVHQEDMCQALGIHPGIKYQNEGGPSPQAIVSAIRRHSSSGPDDAAMFLDALIYNWLIVGTDAHAKNYSFMLQNEVVRLAPLYDVASYLPYVRDQRSIDDLKLAMRVGERYSVTSNDRLSAWRSFAESAGFNADEAVSRAENMARRLPGAFDEAVSALPSKYANRGMTARLRAGLVHRATMGAKLSTLMNR